eukprot:CAMPEP_0117514114 /NCGR_PEP_ID=MMETSP0784-20121206/29904_1 /TAXON_ID=39447 /ORGANISM="" /LENGTH=479 /DNA_ID=CAMNT_0005309903 /DNA_START=105 /DNA_END=1547 /DNA_ORIENTATION=-
MAAACPPAQGSGGISAGGGNDDGGGGDLGPPCSGVLALRRITSLLSSARRADARRDYAQARDSYAEVLKIQQSLSRAPLGSIGKSLQDVVVRVEARLQHLRRELREADSTTCSSSCPTAESFAPSSTSPTSCAGVACFAGGANASRPSASDSHSLSRGESHDDAFPPQSGGGVARPVRVEAGARMAAWDSLHIPECPQSARDAAEGDQLQETAVEHRGTVLALLGLVPRTVAGKASQNVVKGWALMAYDLRRVRICGCNSKSAASGLLDATRRPTSACGARRARVYSLRHEQALGSNRKSLRARAPRRKVAMVRQGHRRGADLQIGVARMSQSGSAPAAKAVRTKPMELWPRTLPSQVAAQPGAEQEELRVKSQPRAFVFGQRREHRPSLMADATACSDTLWALAATLVKREASQLAHPSNMLGLLHPGSHGPSQQPARRGPSLQNSRRGGSAKRGMLERTSLAAGRAADRLCAAGRRV